MTAASPQRRSSLAALSAILLGLSSSAPRPAHAELDHRLALLGGGGFRAHPDAGGHGVFLVGYDLRGLLPREGALSAEFNTDTIRLRMDRLTFLGGRLEVAAFATYEFLLAGLLMDYYREGKLDPSRGFNASYAEAGGSVKLHQASHHTLEVVAGLRRWFFSNNGDTDPALVLPAEAWVFEPRLRYTYWRIASDPSIGERHRLFWRVRGFALGLVLQLDVRSETHPWGARASSTFTPADLRNDPRSASFALLQWIKAGYQLDSRVRTQVAQVAVVGSGLDDLNRFRVGGMNPYVVPVAGAPWAAFLAERLLAAQWSWHIRVFRELETGALIDLAWIDDLERTGASDSGVMAGLGLFADLRLGAFQIDLRAGWAPTLRWQGSEGAVGIFGALGWQWD